MRIWLQLLFCLALTAAAFFAMARLGSSFGPADFASLIVVLLAVSVLVVRSQVQKSLSMVMLGLLVSSVGSDLETGETRLTFGLEELGDGVSLTIITALLLISIPIRMIEVDLTPVRLMQVVNRVPTKFRHAALPALILILCVDSLGSGQSLATMILITMFGLAGYLMLKLGFELTPLVMGCALGLVLEEKLRQALLISRGSLWVFLERPLSLALLLVAILLLVFALLPVIRNKREDIFT